MNNWIEPINVIEVAKSFIEINKGDESTTNLIIAIGSELLDISPDKFLEMMRE